MYYPIFRTINVLIAIIFWLWVPLFAQTSFQTNIYSTKDGLSSDLCRSMYRDRKGFLWISTDKGLNRYDGNSFYTFKHRSDDAGSIANNSCNGILEDSKGRLWVNTDDGLSLFDYTKQTFKNYFPDTTVMPTLGINYTEMAEDHVGRIWIGGYFDVLIFDPSTEKFEKSGWYDFAVKSGIVKSESRNSITQNVVKKSETELWLMTVYGLFSVHTPTNTYTYHPDQKLKDYFAFVIRYIDQDGVLWVGTYDQCFYTYNPAIKKWSHFSCPPKDKGLSDLVLNINKYDENTLLITRTDQLFLYDMKAGSFKRFEWDANRDVGNHSGFSNTLISGDDIYIIKSGSFPFIHLSRKKSLVHKIHIPLPKNFVNNHSYLTPSGKVLTGDWDRNAVLVCDSIQCTWLKEKSGNNKLGNLQLYYPSKSGEHYFTTSQHVYKWDINENIVQLLSENSRENDESQTEFRNFIEDKRGNIYVRERSRGIFIIRKGKKALEYLDCGIHDDNYSAIYYEKATDKIWLATEKKGLYIIDPVSCGYKNYPLFNLAQTRKGFIYDISGDDTGIVFLLIANRGLVHINSRDMIPKLYTSSNGLISDAVRYGCINKELFWFTSESGLMAFDYKKERFYSFENESDSKLFTYRIFTDTTGNITQNLFPEHIISFDQKEFSNRQNNTHIYLKEVKLSGKIIPNDSLFNADYSQNNFVFLFGNIGSQELKSQNFRYRINDQSWQALENSSVSLYNLAPGSYRIQVENMFEPDGVFSLNVNIIPPWWKTNWFYTGLIMLFSLTGYLLYKIRISNVRKEEEVKNQLKQRIAEIEMSSLRAQMNPHFIFNCLNSINRFILVNDTDAASEYLTKFSRLIRMILDGSRENFITLDKEIAALKLYIEMESMRFQDSFNWKIVIEPEVHPEDLLLPPLMLQPYVENAIWHGLMQASNESVKQLKIHISKFREDTKIEISDNGIGRYKAKLLKSKTGDKHKSYGISLTEERLKLMGKLQGTKSFVTIEDLYNENQISCGTKVTIILNQ